MHNIHAPRRCLARDARFWHKHRLVICTVFDARVLVTLALLSVSRLAGAQSRAPQSPASAKASTLENGAELDSLIVRAQSINPTIRATASRVDAARARLGPAASWPDPMLMAGIENLPLGKESSPSAMSGMTSSTGPDPMTMRMIGVSQTIPYPGKLSLQRRAAERDVEVREAALDGARRQITRDVKDAYYEVAFLDQAVSIAERNSAVLGNLIKVSETRYEVGTAGQQDVLNARVEATRLGETAADLRAQRLAALARLNALLLRPSETPIEDAIIPSRVVRAAVPDSTREIHFASSALGSPVTDSPLPPVAELQEMAVGSNPELREQEAMIAGQTTRLELARKSVLPDFDVSLQYGQRPARPDMLTATVSVPLPVFKRSKQNQDVAANQADLAALEAERTKKQADIRSQVAELSSALERSRTQLALYVRAILPQSRAALASATASYQVGKVEFLTVLNDQATLSNYETEYFRALSDFAKNVAELERVVGKEVLR